MKVKNRNNMYDDHQIVENFLPSLPFLDPALKLGYKILQHFLDMCMLTAEILVKIIYLILHPFEAIAFICKLVFAVVMLFCYLIWNIGLKYILHLFFMIIGSWIALVLFVITCFFIAVIMLFDVIIFRGWIYPLYYRTFGASENQPNAWYENGSYQRRNLNDGNFYKCGDNYVPDSSNIFFCSRLNTYEPRFCPTTALYRLYKGNGEKYTFFGHDFQPTSIMKKNINGRNVELTKFILNKLSYLDSCNTYTKKQDLVSKQICKSIDTIADRNNRNRMSNICHEQYCTQGKRAIFCNKLDSNATIQNGVQTKNLVDSKGNDNINEKLYFNTVYLIVLALVISIIMKPNYNYRNYY